MRRIAARSTNDQQKIINFLRDGLCLHKSVPSAVQGLFSPPWLYPHKPAQSIAHRLLYCSGKYLAFTTTTAFVSTSQFIKSARFVFYATASVLTSHFHQQGTFVYSQTVPPFHSHGLCLHKPLPSTGHIYVFANSNRPLTATACVLTSRFPSLACMYKNILGLSYPKA